MTPAGQRLRLLGGGLAGAAVLVAAVTLASRVAGFGRTLGLSWAVGQTCLGSAYATANTVPNVLFEVVAGGALASVVVPLLEQPFRERDAATASTVASALLTWTLLVLVPVALLAALAGPQVADLLTGGSSGGAAATGGCDGPLLAATVHRMLLVFVPQIPVYGLAVVSAGILQSQGRFLAAAAAPLVSSAVVLSAYLWFGSIADARSPAVLRDLPRGSEAVLTLGTTAGVCALAAVTLVPVLSTGLHLRPRLRFPPGVAPRARALALAGLAALLAQQVLTVLVVTVSNARDPDGLLVAWSFTWTLYLLPYAVLAVPLATSAFPTLARHAQREERDEFAAVLATTTRALVLAAGLGSAVLAGTARAASELLNGRGDAPALLVSRGLVAYAPGLVGYALLAHLGRALYALHAGRAAARAAVVGWGSAAVLDLVLGTTLPRGWVVAGFGIGNTVGMLIAGLLLLGAVRVRAGTAALAAVPRALGTAACAAVLASGLAAAVGALLEPQTRAAGLGAGLLGTAVAVSAYGAVAALLDRAGLIGLAGGRRG